MPSKSASIYLVVFMMMLTILTTTLVIVCTQVTLPSKQVISHPIPMKKVTPKLAILPNGNMVTLLRAKFIAPATQLQIEKYQRKDELKVEKHEQ